jgi:hypothetical protein
MIICYDIRFLSTIDRRLNRNKVLFLLALRMQIYMIENDISKVDDGER